MLRKTVLKSDIFKGNRRNSYFVYFVYIEPLHALKFSSHKTRIHCLQSVAAKIRLSSIYHLKREAPLLARHLKEYFTERYARQEAMACFVGNTVLEKHDMFLQGGVLNFKEKLRATV